MAGSCAWQLRLGHAGRLNREEEGSKLVPVFYYLISNHSDVSKILFKF
jgi:hypothetical protein